MEPWPTFIAAARPPFPPLSSACPYGTRQLSSFLTQRDSITIILEYFGDGRVSLRPKMAWTPMVSLGEYPETTYDSESSAFD